ncbi:MULTISPECIES: hypothetical protein [Bradyrhizobium]|uniref:hypothetical protein n=1 Tax=Bradyrhizobium TaxID=374 RepID=UPI00155EEF81|nr:MULTISPECIES: hypothetical protein [Bradyrhizobium]MDD1520020.1 hypothetical protein [Bradyrhizobium sp. WBAH30]MDD1544264.1 hypothetical protein [Bradyrhizobium sp. WBAH41]MDD1558146.1 hypothetical protein [Bradyrhizobium sp. WBAH23]MDD1565544.1 hypothetical protein [Bradyrhizobium sp. WBAH33]MDD1590674.1 hypothetical protein [Bradyrhizobium sp. WBAH42]
MSNVNLVVTPRARVTAERVKDILQRIGNINERLGFLCTGMELALERLGRGVGDASDQVDYFSDVALEFEIAAHDLDGVVRLVNKFTS